MFKTKSKIGVCAFGVYPISPWVIYIYIYIYKQSLRFLKVIKVVIRLTFLKHSTT
jgi:hypothetical protein